MKGLEVAPTDEARPEFGGRYQTPTTKGEMAISLHHRKIDKDEWRMSQVFGLITSDLQDGREDRIAIDGFWDVGIGLWFETVRGRSTSALSTDYAISIMDRINSIVTYDWVEHETQGFVGWQRTYDDWRINLLGFSGPEVGTGKYSGDGVELIVTYNH